MHLDNNQRKQVFGLDLHQIAIMVLLSFALLAMVNISAVVIHFSRNTILSKAEVQSSFADQLKTWFSSPILNTITLVAFWIVVGLMAYAVLYWLYSVITEARNEVIVEKDYVNKQSRKGSKKWPFIELGLLICLASLAIVTMTLLFPIWNSLFLGFVFDMPGEVLSAVLQLVAAMAGMFANVYLFKVLISVMLIEE